MLKLKYLFDNRDLAKMILGNWEYDPSSTKMFKYYRISSNAVYPFKSEDKVKLLRFAPCTEKNKNNIIGELEFIKYLKLREYPVLCTVPSKDNQELLEVSTPWGEYFAVVFDRVAGVQLEQIDYTYDICRKHGKSLGKLHKLSSEYKPDKELRWSYEDVLTWIEKELSSFSDETLAMQEIKLLKEFFSKLPKNEQTYGMVHYDFEMDNIFYDKDTDMLNIIDFDDSMYHWYAMDIEQALNSIVNEVPCEDYSLTRDFFIKGYREEFSITDEMLSYLTVFRRFADLYGYVRVLLSTKEVWDNEPEWMMDLRIYLATLMKDSSKHFGDLLV
ncbi:phosphotransferase enzyme family protein [Alkaliphilus peptidifermentans]|uniref:Ser/Thr protein kinase RdoA involved in Cpx stress response, MazF antagonist n=1 Tax=Alkaliphilus peptidifermentans DSM 18978 TaxID=1120976 RepID=A0A1G5GTX3_9FIRM|nr:phosphotransferase [Alkaliphilus peptidifermentans]SCY55045.1 Ser/Thr protein kinase RdoA involved in Cpx stress response, MazF antagonist [Alkaliphilus peptidifermentans DSM 18978]